MRVLSSIAVLMLSAPPIVWAQLTPQQVISYNQARELRFSPDSQWLALTVEGGPKGPARPRDIWLIDSRSGQVTRLSSDGASESAQWSPDGAWLAYLSGQNGTPQVYIVKPGGGATQQLTHHVTGIQAFEWSPDGRQIAFLAAADVGPPQQESSKNGGDDPRIIKIVSGTDVPVQLSVTDVQSKSERPVTSGTFDVSQFTWKVDGTGFVVIAREQPNPEQWSERIYSLELVNGEHKEIVATRGPLDQLRISPDGSRIAYLASRGGEGEAPSDLFVVPIGGGTPKDLTQGLDRSVQQFQWTDAANLTVLLQFGFTNQLYHINTAGKAAPMAGSDPNAQSFAVSRAADVAFVREAANELPEVWLRKGNRGAARQISHLNEQWQGAALAKAELIHYTSADGTAIEGQLLQPAGTVGGNLPTIILIHGGPVGRWADQFDPEGQLLASHGYAVFYPNIRGASSYGDRMIGMIRSTARGGSGWATGPLSDVVAGADELVKRRVADPARLGVGGWSYGGYMTALALSRTDKFKVGVAGAGFYDMVTDLGTEIAGYVPGDEWMYGNFYDPRTQQLLHEDSPIATIHQLHAPLLLMHPELDPVDTIGQAFEFYRALHQQGVKTEFVVYPREGHELNEEAHVVDRLTRTLAWYDRYLR